MIQKTIRSYLKLGLNGILKRENTFHFYLRKRDRIHLQNVLQQEVSYSWNYKRAHILLIETRETGMRPGEKLYEELYFDSEKTIQTAHPKFRCASHRRFKWNVVDE